MTFSECQMWNFSLLNNLDISKLCEMHKEKGEKRSVPLQKKEHETVSSRVPEQARIRRRRGIHKFAEGTTEIFLVVKATFHGDIRNVFSARGEKFASATDAHTAQVMCRGRTVYFGKYFTEITLGYARQACCLCDSAIGSGIVLREVAHALTDNLKLHFTARGGFVGREFDKDIVKGTMCA